MSNLSDHVSLQIVVEDSGVSRLGFGTPMILSHSATWVERLRYYTDLPGVGDDFATSSPEYLAARAMFAQSPHPDRIAIGRAVNKPTQAYATGAASVANNQAYAINVVGQGVTSTAVSITTDGAATAQEIHTALVAALNAVVGANYTAAFAPMPSLTPFTFTCDHTVPKFIHAAHGMQTGDGPVRVSNSGGALPTGLAGATDYYVIVIDANDFNLATSRANALAGTAVAVTTDNGTGTQTLTPQAGALSPFLPFLTTGNAPGNWFSLEITNPTLLSNKQTHADPGVAADLDAIQQEQSDWYGIYTLFNSQGLSIAVAGWAEAETKIYIPDYCNTRSITAAYTPSGTGDALEAIRTANYTRTAGAYHPSPAQMMGAAWFGRMLPILPGSDDWKWKSLAGVNAVSLTATHRANLRARAANTIETVAGKNITWEGTVGDADFIDTTRGLDWIQDDMTKAVLGSLIAAQRTPFTDNGIALVQNEMLASLKRAVSMGILSNSPKPTVQVPAASDVSGSDKSARDLTGMKFFGTLAGAIHRVQMTGTISV